MTLRALCKQSGSLTWNALSAASSGLPRASDIVDSSVARSLLTVLPGDDGAIGYRLMNLARAYGLEKYSSACKDS
jgi:hypothetical protein